MDCTVTPLKTLMGFSVHLNVQLKFYNLPNQKKLFGISAIICIILLANAYFGDLAISNTLINYHSWVGIICQTFGEFPVYLIFALCGQIAMTYAWRGGFEKLMAVPLFVGGLTLSL